MPTPLDWTTPYNNFLTVYTAAPSYRQALVQQEKQDIETLGATYDATRAALGSQLEDAEDDYATRHEDWLSNITVTGTGWAETDGIVRYLEGRQTAALLGTQLDPTVYQSPDGATHVLAPGSPTSFDGDGNPPAAAFRVLLAGPTPILRVTALREGTGGNAIRVQVSNATSTRSDRFNLYVTLGSYIETYEDFDASDPSFAPQQQSLLTLTPLLVGLGRPDNLAPADLTGGGGDALSTLEDRVKAALTFTAVGAFEKRVLNTTLAAARDAFNGRPAKAKILTDFERDRVVPLQAAIDVVVRATSLLNAL